MRVKFSFFQTVLSRAYLLSHCYTFMEKECRPLSETGMWAFSRNFQVPNLLYGFKRGCLSSMIVPSSRIAVGITEKFWAQFLKRDAWLSRIWYTRKKNEKKEEAIATTKLLWSKNDLFQWSKALLVSAFLPINHRPSPKVWVFVRGE